eukprot:CAMPEP_0172601512 /NCGR_PEP_ID=MMETSP1068-20121228/21670_1 /TAXON_ID=35684 /ORGANISM="Pseudopedinella elastica, Strain CCMP716" /LENGTH=51 /DNA_ID=CAMNT_0013402523 /DNA_START=50 /DNA_END=202 /DNA_ORIENTATION=-
MSKPRGRLVPEVRGSSGDFALDVRVQVEVEVLRVHEERPLRRQLSFPHPPP